MRRLALLLILALTAFNTSSQSLSEFGRIRPPPPDILWVLQHMKGVENVQELSTSLQGYRYFLFDFRQPSDHEHPHAGTFLQRATLLHRDYNAAMVLHTPGYYVSTSGRRSEPAALLEANQLSLEHRFFQPSRPEPADWSLMTIKQSAGDSHRLAKAFKRLYAKAWISTGASKGGMTAVYHRRFYPDDVVGTVPYVSPLSLAAPDSRYAAYLENLGSDFCRAKIEAMQREALQRRDRLALLLQSYATQEELTYQQASYDMAVEGAVVDSWFYLWQYYDAAYCEIIPGPEASDEELFAYLDAISGFGSYSDQGLAYFEPYYYQALAELGYPLVSTRYVSDLMKYSDADWTIALLSPDIPLPTYQASAMADIDAWVRDAGNTLMFVYGSNDPWTAGAFSLGDASDSYLYFIPGENHGAKLADLADEEYSEALTTLARWTGAQRDSVLTRSKKIKGERFDMGLISEQHPYWRPRP